MLSFRLINWLKFQSVPSHPALTIHLQRFAVLINSVQHFVTWPKEKFPQPIVMMTKNQLRVIAKPVTFADITNTAFNQIRQYGRTSVAVMMRLLEAIAVIAPCTHIKADRAALLHHANMIEHSSQKGITEESDRKDVRERYLSAIKAIGQV